MSPRFRPARVARVVAVTAGVGTAAATAVALTPWAYRARIHATPAWTAVVLVLAAVGELAYVRMRHPDYDALRGMLDDVGRTLHVHAA